MDTLTFGQTSGQDDIWSDVPPPGRDILWPSMILLQVRLTLGQMDPQNRDILWPSVILPWFQVDILVRSLGQVDIWSDGTPRQRYLGTKCDTTLGQVDIWADLQVRLTIWSDGNPHNWNAYTLNPLSWIYWRASLVKAATVLSAPLVYIKVVAVESL